MIVILAVTVYAYMEFTRTRADLQTVSPKFSATATGLLNEFAKNDSAANKKYEGLNVVLSVTGMVTGTEKDDKGNYTVLLGDTSSMSSVRCSMDNSYAQQAAGLSKGSNVTIRGYFIGYKPDDLGVGADIELNLCVLEKNKNN